MTVSCLGGYGCDSTRLPLGLSEVLCVSSCDSFVGLPAEVMQKLQAMIDKEGNLHAGVSIIQGCARRGLQAIT